MQLIYKICSACSGLGEVPFIPQVSFDEESSIKRGSAIKCGRCKGRGYVPTGDFILESNEPILKQIEDLNDPIIIQIIKNKL